MRVAPSRPRSRRGVPLAVRAFADARYLGQYPVGRADRVGYRVASFQFRLTALIDRARRSVRGASSHSVTSNNRVLSGGDVDDPADTSKRTDAAVTLGATEDECRGRDDAETLAQAHAGSDLWFRFSVHTS